MYNDRSTSFTFKHAFLKLVLIVVVAFIVVGFFPTKSYVKNLIDSRSGNNANKIFNENAQIMKEAALSYYNGDRLPSKTSKLTLKEMINKNLLIELTDEDGKQCNEEKSYVKVTKNKNDYKMEVNLVCSNKKGKVMSYFGTDNYCESGVCEKKKIN